MARGCMKTRVLRIVTAILVVGIILTAGIGWKYDVFTKVRFIGNNPREAVFYLFQKLRKDGLMTTIRSVQEKLGNDPRLGLGYSLYDPKAAPPVESRDARNALPEYKVIPAVDVASLPDSRQPQLPFDTWARGNADDLNSKFSSLDQVNTATVSKLQVAWKYTFDSHTKSGVRVESNPVIVNGRIFVASTDSDLLSLDASSGRELWRVSLPAPANRRGLVWEPNADFGKSRLFVPTANGVYALNAATGAVLKDFGNGGEVGDQMSVIAPVIAEDKLIVAIIKPAIEAYDLRTGRQIWTTPLLETPKGERTLLTGASPWSGMSYDAVRGRVFVSTGNPRPELWGISRPGPNEHSCSVVAIDTATGHIAWSFQEVSHDLWDLDVSSPPILTTITKGGRKVDVVATVTKIGNTLLLDRDRGQPIFDYRLRKAPASAVAGEQTAPYQPDLELPEPFLKSAFEPSDVTDISEAARAAVLQKIRTAKTGFFEPPILGGAIVLYGLGGAAIWPGGAVDQRKGILYVPSSQAPTILRANYRDLRGTQRSVAGMPGDAPYQSMCAQCHGPARDGVPKGGGAHVPALTGITLLRSKDELTSKSTFADRHRDLKVDAEAAGSQLAVLYDYFDKLDRIADQDKAFAVRTFWDSLQDNDGHPGSKPPWGFLTALDLNSGHKVWQVPLGEYDTLLRNGKPVQGQMNNAGAIVTAGGLVFATGTLDRRIRAFDSATGHEAWSAVLDMAGTAPPSTYLLNGRQYVVVVTSTDAKEEVVAFSLSTGGATR